MSADPTGWQDDGSYIPCPECKLEPVVYEGPGVPVRQPGTIHRSTCPTVPHLSPEAQERLRAKMADIARCEREAWIKSRGAWIR